MSDHAGRRGYDSDLTDAQWELVEPLLPPERGGRGWGRPLTNSRREIVNAILYMARAGCSWRPGPGEDGDALSRTDLRRRRLRWTAGRLRPPNAAHRRARRAQTRGQRGFAVPLSAPAPGVARTLSWLTAHRRLARDYERLPEHSEAWVKWAMIGLMTRRLAPHPAANARNDHFPNTLSGGFRA